MAFITGGNYLKSAEVYSPNGNCSFSRSPMPVSKYRHSLVWRDKAIIACAGQDDPDCYSYFIANDTWALYSTAPSRTYLPNTLYNDKLFFSNYDTSSLSLDLATKAWSTWPPPPGNNYGGCQVVWRDAFLRFGGDDWYDGVLMFNHTTQNWTTLLIGGPEFYFSGCTLLTNDKVLLAGLGAKYNVYGIFLNKYIFNGTLYAPMQDMGLVKLGNRVFVLQGAQTNPQLNIVQEFNPSDYSMTNVTYLLKDIRDGMAAVSVPAKLFRGLLPTCTGVS